MTVLTLILLIFNIYFKNLTKDFYFNFFKFGSNIIGKRKKRGINYYISPYPEHKNKSIFQIQQDFFKYLHSRGIHVAKCRFSPESNKIKGDDIHLAVDMLDDAVRNQYNVGILISGDGDFVPLVKKIHSWHKKVELWFFDEQTSYLLKKTCDETKRISRTLVRKCYRPKLK
ncbi:MAG: NYN domain-containing protein [Promethearchaeota archaeon]